MRQAIVAVLLGLVGAVLTVVPTAGTPLVETNGPRRTWSFGQDDVGKPPAGWKAEYAGDGKGSVWKVVGDDTAPSRTGRVLTQTAAAPRAFINLCVVEDTGSRDVEAGVAFKDVGGTNNRGGGIVWRYQDRHNYYFARLDTREDNFRVYKVVSGRCIELASREDVKVADDEWHTLEIEMHGDHVRCYLDGTKHLDVRDSTIGGAGKVGLWTRGSARTRFDNFQVRGK
jgi:hypothetical protein